MIYNKNPWDIFNDVDKETKQEFELSNILVDIACKIINYRLDNDMTQKDLANKLEITQAMVSKLESGEYNPSIEFLFKISKKLDWKFELTFEENNSNPSAPIEQKQPYRVPINPS
ncbi:MAG: helix-turn-helix transcriptional regulator [Peptostreptococcales bacterium]